MLIGKPLYLREERKLATTTITNELAEAINNSLGLPSIGHAFEAQQRTPMVLAEITGKHRNRVGIYDAKSIVGLKPYNPTATGAVKKEEIGTPSEGVDLVVVSPAQAYGGSQLNAGDLVLAVIIGETNRGLAYSYAVPGSGGGSLFPVRVTKDGGSAGNAKTQCSFTYTVKDITNTNTLGTGVEISGNGQRIVNATMIEGTYGIAYFKDGNVKLMWVDERFSQEGCT